MYSISHTQKTADWKCRLGPTMGKFAGKAFAEGDSAMKFLKTFHPRNFPAILYVSTDYNTLPTLSYIQGLHFAIFKCRECSSPASPLSQQADKDITLVYFTRAYTHHILIALQI